VKNDLSLPYLSFSFPFYGATDEKERGGRKGPLCCRLKRGNKCLMVDPYALHLMRGKREGQPFMRKKGPSSTFSWMERGKNPRKK